MSTPLVYVCDPNNISGALYQRVATYSVRTGEGASYGHATDLTNPKSATLTEQSLFNRIFEGFKSLCNNSAECMYLMLLRI